ncbi:hypothetical protein, partial [Streptomyces sp. McG3]|uniref:hypothetical protein n=1 Tax=Streptomyces sp. McG3 TaxID=2725483 RepID=UPI0027E43BE6
MPGPPPPTASGSRRRKGSRAPAAAVLVSQGKPATASSTEGPFGAAAAVDGDTATRWSSAF